MNKPLTLALKKEEVRKIMARIAKCDRRIEHGIRGVVPPDMVQPHETETQRKQRLLERVSILMAEIKNLEG